MTAILRALVVVHIGLQFADFGSTYLALSAGGVEANPITRAVLEGYGWSGFFVMKAIVALGFVGLWPMVAWLEGRDAKITAVAMSLFAAFMLVVVVNNAVVAQVA